MIDIGIYLRNLFYLSFCLLSTLMKDYKRLRFLEDPTIQLKEAFDKPQKLRNLAKVWFDKQSIQVRLSEFK